MYDAINESIFETLLTAQTIINKGWKFENLDYGERRLGIGPSLVVSRGGESITIYDPSGLEELAGRE